MEDQYYNMADQLKKSMHIVETAVKAMEALGIKPDIAPIRGGTDGSSLSQRGLPTPNLFTGGNNFHGRFEFLPIPSLEKGVDVVIKIIQLYGCGGDMK
jgi:tripeptide aminopeptidase